LRSPAEMEEEGMLTEAVARKLGIEPRDLERESLQAYLEARRRQVEAQLFLLGTKHGVRTVQELDAAIQEGKIREAEGFEDFFALDHLEAERDKILEALNSLP
jgi:hypothetical protein